MLKNKEFNQLREKYHLHDGTIDDVAWVLKKNNLVSVNMRDEIHKKEYTEYQIVCPFADHDCDHQLVETVVFGEEMEDDLEMMLLAVASHMISEHPERVPSKI